MRVWWWGVHVTVEGGECKGRFVWAVGYYLCLGVRDATMGMCWRRTGDSAMVQYTLHACIHTRVSFFHTIADASGPGCMLLTMATVSNTRPSKDLSRVRCVGSLHALADTSGRTAWSHFS